MVFVQHSASNHIIICVVLTAPALISETAQHSAKNKKLMVISVYMYASFLRCNLGTERS